MKPYISNISEEERRALLACIAVFVNEGCYSVPWLGSSFDFPEDIEVSDLVTKLYPEKSNEIMDILNTL